MSEETRTEMTEATETAEKLAPLALAAEGVKIETQAHADDASAALSEIKAAEKRIAEYCDPAIKSAKSTYEMLRDQKKTLLEPFVAAETSLKGKLTYWLQQREEKKAKEIARLQAESGEDDLVISAPEPTLTGVQQQTRWTAELVNMNELIKAAANGNIHSFPLLLS